jgi:small conductance mechanosensitive channel
MAEEDGYRDQFLDAPEVWGIQALGPDSVDIRLVIKTQPGKQWAISRELRRRLKAACDATGIEIPYPQRTVWMRNDDEKSSVGVEADGHADIEAAVATARRGDRGAERVLAQDENLLAAEVEEEAAEDVGAKPAGG